LCRHASRCLISLSYLAGDLVRGSYFAGTDLYVVARFTIIGVVCDAAPGARPEELHESFYDVFTWGPCEFF
jgi:hypothetical protein